MPLNIPNVFHKLFNTRPLVLDRMPNRQEDWSYPIWCQLWWWPVWQQSISRLKRAECQRIQVSVQQQRWPSGADSAGWGVRLPTQHTVCRAPFALSADVVIEWGIQFHSGDKHLIHRKAHWLALSTEKKLWKLWHCPVWARAPWKIERDLLK